MAGPPTRTHLPAARVTVRGLHRAFSHGSTAHLVLRDIDLDVPPGETLALLGPSGCGKSTLLRQIAGLDRPTGGSVEIDGATVHDVHPRCAVVFQEPRLLAWRTLAANVALGLPRGGDRAEGRARIRHWLDVVGLADFHDHRPHQISGGMAQRVALARALARRPGVLLLDEPLAALDALTRLRMQDLIDRVQREAGTTVVLVTHDVEEALHLADRVALLGHAPDRPGATVRGLVDVPPGRPRDRGDRTLAALRADLLERLGVPRRSGPTLTQETP
ncbi:ABC transporter ATP-binding protein [Nocardiopsis sp. MG754419]|uniref:ABC transporter ATP-binding protein n=1 Tax=Nocardiopsis sp. MG754419 TaxID=2259865 RepID=UPI001BA92A00|nr:ABC transporter ATP-binding protein [Nocardiopsis sp. MG754419]MBR8743928.1 ABC transporter ATP-binding protein [Nocardiopsis sp. MG754419]